MKIEDAIKTLEFYNFPAAKITEHEDAVAAAELAISALRAQAERENPKPLTLEQLKERDGNPVWTVTNGVYGSGGWELIKFTIVCACPWHEIIECVRLDEEQYGCEISTYGKTWLAYDHEPKEANNEQD